MGFRRLLDIEVGSCYRLVIMMGILSFRNNWNFFRIKNREYYMINLGLIKMPLSYNLMNFRRYIKIF